MYKIELTQSAKKELEKLPGEARQRVARVVDGLATEPRPSGVKKLTDQEDLYRVRAGAYRVLYAIREDVLVVLVVKIADRKDAYRGLR